MATIRPNELALRLTERADDAGLRLLEEIADDAVRMLAEDAPRRTGALADSVQAKRGAKPGVILVVMLDRGFILERWKRSPHRRWMKRTRDRINRRLAQLAP